MRNPRWINTCERNPGDDREVHVIQVDTQNNINRTTGHYQDGKWSLLHDSRGVVAWLESESALTDEEAQNVPLVGIRTPYSNF